MTISSIRLAPRRATLSVIAKAGVLILLAVSFGCANGEIRPGDPFDREQELEEAQHRYTVLMRWSQFQKAQKFVARKERGAFLERMKVLEDARFTDYESDEIDISEDLDSATVRVKYTLYLTNSRILFNGSRQNLTLRFHEVLGVNLVDEFIEVEKESGRNPHFAIDGDVEVWLVALSTVLNSA